MYIFFFNFTLHYFSCRLFSSCRSHNSHEFLRYLVMIFVVCKTRNRVLFVINSIFLVYSLKKANSLSALNTIPKNEVTWRSILSSKLPVHILIVIIFHYRWACTRTIPAYWIELFYSKYSYLLDTFFKTILAWKKKKWGIMIRPNSLR